MAIFKNPRFKISLLLFSIFYFLSSIIPPAVAETMSNSNYKLKADILNTKGDELKAYENKNNASVNSNKEEPRFVFSISQTLIDYGLLSPTNPVIRTNTLTIENNFLSGFTVSAYENQNLQSQSLDTIPNTTCDSGSCNFNDSAIWNSILTYGFGYRCDNVLGSSICANGFSNTNYYKQFPDISNSQNPQVVLTSLKLGKNNAEITYKVNISQSQQKGFYNNTITFIATPNF